MSQCSSQILIPLQYFIGTNIQFNVLFAPINLHFIKYFFLYKSSFFNDIFHKILIFTHYNKRLVCDDIKFNQKGWIYV